MNKYKIKSRYTQFKQHCKYWVFRVKDAAVQIFIPLAIFQLIRTLIFPTPFDVILLIIIFLVVIYFLLDWI